MPETTPQLTPQHQAIRTMLAAINPTQFAALRAALEQNRAAIDAQLAVIDAARAQLQARKGQLDTVLEHIRKPDGLDILRNAMLKGERLGAKTVKPRPRGGTPPQP